MKMRLAVKMATGINLGLLSLNSYSGMCTTACLSNSCISDNSAEVAACQARQNACFNDCMKQNDPSNRLPSPRSSYNYGNSYGGSPSIPPSPSYSRSPCLAEHVFVSGYCCLPDFSACINPVTGQVITR